MQLVEPRLHEKQDVLRLLLLRRRQLRR